MPFRITTTRFDRRRVNAMLSVVVLLGAGCTPIANTLQPYRRDATAAQALEQRAYDYCAQSHGRTPPHRFTTDGCSFWPDDGWVQCCVEHDIAYWCGGSADDRERADEGLRDCVARDHGATLGEMMYLGVRVGGIPWQPFPWRWAYGWECCRGYDERSHQSP